MKYLLILLIAFIRPVNVCEKYDADVISVYDGDTITCDLDVGFGIHLTEKIRVARIDAPEVRGAEKVEGFIARDALRELILNKEVVITNKGRGKYGRVIGEIEIDGINVSDWLVENDYAEYKDY
jgi:micrococcal nuclease